MNSSILLGFLIFNLTLNLSYAYSRVIEHRHPDRVLVISLDGIQAGLFESYLKSRANSSFHEIIKNGVKAEYMIPVFPTVTWPNHYSIVTGLYPEHHGIIDNYVYDQNLDEKVNFLGGSNAYDPKFWKQAKPIWMTARQQGLKTATSYWVGSEITGQTPDIWIKYDSGYWQTFTEDYKVDDRVDDALNWILKFDLDLTFLYISEPDSHGHVLGPTSAGYMNHIANNDRLIRKILDKLKDVDHLNIIVLSDHGMTSSKPDCAINVYNYLNMSQINTRKSIFGFFSQIYPSPGYEESVYNSLKKIPNIEVYYKNDIPKRFRFSNSSNRIAPIVAIANEGYSLINTNGSCMKGQHGHDNTLESMRTIFLAQGPAFKSEQTLAAFENVNIYPLLCEILQINCETNNGTTRVFASALNAQATLKKSNSLIFLLILTFFKTQ